MASPFSTFFQDCVFEILKKKRYDVTKNKVLVDDDLSIKADLFVSGKEKDTIIRLELHRMYPQANVIDVIYWCEKKRDKKDVKLVQFFSPFYDTNPKGMHMSIFLAEKMLESYSAVKIKDWNSEDFEKAYNACDRKVAQKYAQKVSEEIMKKI